MKGVARVGANTVLAQEGATKALSVISSRHYTADIDGCRRRIGTRVEGQKQMRLAAAAAAWQP